MQMETTRIETADPARRLESILHALNGVPKAALQAVFGKGLGGRIWQQVRRPVRMRADAQSAPEPGVVSNEEIVAGMLSYVTCRAAETLGRNRRSARAIALRLVYLDGLARVQRSTLPRTTSDAQQLYAAAMSLYQRAESRGGAVMAVNLTLSTVQREPVNEHSGWLKNPLVTAVATQS
jgi:impB/mucB/samB family C-terminal domain